MIPAFLQKWLGVELIAVSAKEKLVAAAGGALAIFLLLFLTARALPAAGAMGVIGSMGASAVLLFGVLALLPPMLENLMGYPVVLTGLVTAPRGVGTLVTMTLSGFLIKRFDPRLLIFCGFGFAAWSMYRMSHFSLGMDSTPVMVSGFIQGLGTGLVFVPLATIAFATLNPAYRNEGAAMFTLIRNIGSAAGISILQAVSVRSASTVHSRLVEGVRPDNPVLAQSMPGFDFDAPAMVARMNGEITRQAAMVSYTDAYHLLFLLSLAILPLLLLMRHKRRAAGGEDLHLHLD